MHILYKCLAGVIVGVEILSERAMGQVRGSDIECADVVRDLGVYLDSELSTKNRVNKIASACFCHIRRLRQIRHCVSPEVLKQLATSLVLSRLDYCNSVLVDLPASILQ